MSGKLIALESTNQQLLDKTARFLALTLQAEGKEVEVIGFPQAKQNSAYFATTHQKGDYGRVNPYAASMFYILDRYDANPLIKQYLDRGAVVICKGFRGTTLARLGLQIPDTSARKGFYIWADTLESGTFGAVRPDIAIVLSEEVPTLYELCELFPKDYIFAVDPTKVRSILNKIIPPAVVVNKKSKNYTISLHEILVMSGQGAKYDFRAGKNYATLSEKSKAHKLYADGLHELEKLKGKVLKKIPAKLHSEAEILLSPISILGSTTDEFTGKKPYKNRIFDTLISKNFNDTYGAELKGNKVLQALPRNELDSLQGIVLAKSAAGLDDIQKALSEMSVTQKAKILKAYLAGTDNNASEYPLNGVAATIACTVSFADFIKLIKIAPDVRFTLQEPNPRWGYDIPDAFNDVIDEIEDCFASSLKLHGKLEAAGEEKHAYFAVLGGHKTPCTITINGADIRRLATVEDWAFAVSITELLSEYFPIITNTKS